MQRSRWLWAASSWAACVLEAGCGRFGFETVTSGLSPTSDASIDAPFASGSEVGLSPEPPDAPPSPSPMDAARDGSQEAAPSAQLANFPQFSAEDKDQLVLNGAARIVDGVLLLTPDKRDHSGSAFLRNPFSITGDAGFGAKFVFRSKTLETTEPADGLALLIQGAGPTTLGALGGNIGYGGIPKSVAIELDEFKQSSESVPANHLALCRNGNDQDHAALATLPFAFANGQLRYVWVDYDGKTNRLSAAVSETDTQPSSPQISFQIDLAQAVASQIFVGFTSSTGGYSAEHVITAWSMWPTP